MCKTEDPDLVGLTSFFMSSKYRRIYDLELESLLERVTEQPVGCMIGSQKHWSVSAERDHTLNMFHLPYSSLK
jgi:hypothetical protein